MEFVYADELLNLEINLKCLRRDSQRYSILLLQHEGVLFASNDKIGNSTNVTAQITSFFKLAKHRNVDLVITPEYSTPWEIITNIVKDPEMWVGQDKLWVVGAESISKEELRSFKEKNNNRNVTILFDETLLKETNTFFDPLIYFFISNHNSHPNLIVLIQFKTRHMGVWNGGDIERNNLIQGEYIYVIRNSPASICLMSFICSEAMNFRDELTPEKKGKLKWDDQPYLIINPQLNPDPAHHFFTSFRKFVLQFERKEIIVVNWNVRSKIHRDYLVRWGASRSGIFLQSSEINFSNLSRIKQNHKVGLYYFYFGQNKHAFICNSSIHAFLIENLPVQIGNVLPVQSRRDGPEVIEILSYDPVGDLVALLQVSDQHIEHIIQIGCTNEFLINTGNCLIEKERLACLTSIEIIGANNWFEIENLLSIRIDDKLETNKKLTLAEDTSTESLRQRQLYIRAITSLSNAILINKTCYPESISDLKQFDIVIGYTQLKDQCGAKYIALDKYKYNVTTSNGDRISATICFLDHPTDAEVNEKFDILQSLFDHDNNNKGRVVIFYSRGTAYFSKSDLSAGKIQNTNDFSSPSYLKD